MKSSGRIARNGGKMRTERARSSSARPALLRRRRVARGRECHDAKTEPLAHPALALGEKQRCRQSLPPRPSVNSSVPDGTSRLQVVYSAGPSSRNEPHGLIWALAGEVNERHAPRRCRHMSNAGDLSSGGARALARRLAVNVPCPECGASEGELCERSLLAPSTRGRSHFQRWRATRAGERHRNGFLPNDE